MGKTSEMNYYANILSMHQMLRQIHALKLVLETNGKFDKKFENQQFHLDFFFGGEWSKMNN